ncbi:MAG TPA: DUF3108 domain-containing protein [Stellaceae bacterium]|nr:DUF3108 domain-containing protein [Stellaceae bacterium]
MLRPLAWPVLLAAVLSLVAALPLAAAEDVVRMEFEGFGPAGLHVLDTHTVIAEDSSQYEIQGDFSTTGLASLVASVANRSMTRGRTVGDKPRPVSFDSETDRNGVVQHLRVDYKPDGTPSGSANPPPKEPVTPVSFTQLGGTVDNLTAYLLLEKQVARGAGCGLRVPVFDGRHRYDLLFSDGGLQLLSPAAGQNFSGQTHVCRMTRSEIGGFYVDKSHEEGARAGTIWYAALLPHGDIAVPVRMEMETEIGKVTLFLARLHGPGVSLKLMD